jgi:hypothetical protein
MLQQQGNDMTPREVVKTAFRFEPTDEIPYWLGITDAVDTVYAKQQAQVEIKLAVWRPPSFHDLSFDAKPSRLFLPPNPTRIAKLKDCPLLESL